MSVTSMSSGSEEWRPRLATMTVTQKRELLEAIWDDLAENPEAFESPEWHREILESRRKAIEDGTAVFEDWEVVKLRLRELCK